MSPIDRRTFVRRSLGLAGAAGAGALGAERLSGTHDRARRRRSDAAAPRRASRASTTASSTPSPSTARTRPGILTPRPGAGDVRRARRGRARPQRVDVRAAGAERAGAHAGGGGARRAVRGRRAAGRLRHPRPDDRARRADGHDRLRRLAVRRPLRARGQAARRSSSAMPPFAGETSTPSQTHGDVLLQICASQRDTVVHALRELMRTTRGALSCAGRSTASPGAPRADAEGLAAQPVRVPRRHRQPGHRDDPGSMRRLVWDAQGGSYQVVRLIRMHVEFWDRVGLREQENMIGRAARHGAPLGGDDEFQDPRYDLDPKGDADPARRPHPPRQPAHAATDDQRFLRRPYNYHRGFDSAGSLDQGMLFMAYNQDPARQFAHGPEPPRRRADGRLLHPRRRRLLLRPARHRRQGRLDRPGPLRLGHADAAAPVGLGRVERGVGAGGDGVGGLARLPADQAGRAADALRRRRASRPAGGRRSSRRRSRSQSGSSTANSSPPRRASRSTPRRTPRQPARRGLQQRVAGLVAVGVVVGLEAIEVDRGKAQRPVVARRAGQLDGQPLVPQPPVGQPRQRVGPGQVAQALQQPAALDRRADLGGQHLDQQLAPVLRACPT